MNNPVGDTGRLKQSVCRWCYSSISLDDVCKMAAALGLGSVELLGADDWPTVTGHGLTCAVANSPGTIEDGWNRVENHDALVQASERLLRQCAEAGIPNMVVFSGSRRGLPDTEGLENCALGLARILPLAESLGVTVLMELLNSKIDHPDYQCDHTAWGAALAERLGSDRFRLLYDIYHMQIMEGDVIATIRQFHSHIGHFHTAGVPGRHEIDATQELNYRAIAQAIADTGFSGYLAHEFMPAGDSLTALRQAVDICTV